MVGLETCDRHFTKFLWLHNHRKPPTNDNIVTYCFHRVPFGLICSAFLLSATIHLHLSRAATPLSNEILESCYVDNIFLSASSKSEAIQKYQDTKSLFLLAGMNAREWTSSDAEVNNNLQALEKAPVDQVTKLLGLAWDVNADTISIRLPSLPTPLDHPTKRAVLKIVASIYDPLGLVTPITVVAKMFLQSLWRKPLQWDELLLDDQLTAWKEIVSTWTQPSIVLPRFILPPNANLAPSQLHVFTDASKTAYCAVAYLRTQSGQDTIVQLLMGRSRLSPLHNTVTIPRLELGAIALGATLMHHLIREFRITITQQYLWSDSKAALQWTKSTDTLPVFIQNRVKTIRKNAPDAVLRYVPTNCNPADIGSRGSTIAQLLENTLWWNGPSFLRDPEEAWPEDKSENLTSEIASPAVVSTTPPENEVPIFDDLTSFRSWNSLLRVTILVITFFTKLRSRISTKHGRTTSKINLNHAATITLFRQAQLYHPISSEQKRNLRAYFDNETRLWRSRGRTSNSLLSFDANNPIILPRRTRITELYILHLHVKNHHTGTSQTLTFLRQLVWIPQGRAEVQRVLKNFCFYCKREKAKPFQLPPFPDHPIERLRRPLYPFLHSAVDYLGPFTLRTQQETTKSWIALFTCLNTRAIHVDIAQSLSASCFLHILRRFIAINGSPKYILSDNAPAFVAVSESLPSSTNIQHQEIIDYCSTHDIHFKFIAALAPWQGGLYERMIGIFKISFKAAIKNRILEYDEFITLMKECEAIVNSRPITYVYSDIESGYPLRPIDFLRPHSLIGSPRLTAEDDTDDEWRPADTQRELLLKQWTTTLTLLNTFWERWNEEYLTNLRESFQHEHRQPFHTSSQLPLDNQIVLIHDATRPRGQWKLGRIVTHSDHSAHVQLPSGKTISRPLNLLYPLEIPSPAQDNTSSPHVDRTKRPDTTKDVLPRSTTTTTRIHPMVTRSLSRQPSNTILTAILLLCSVTTLNTHHYNVPDTKCKHELSSRRLIHADNCVSNGIAIAISTTRTFCWFSLSCPLGHIRIPKPFKVNTRYCDAECKCPDWTNTCSHYNGMLTTTSTSSYIPLSISTFLPPQVCSFTPSTLCSSEPRMGAFHQIQLYDNTLMIVPELHVQSADTLSRDDFYCVDIDGNIITSPADRSSITGTTAFCRHHTCSPTKTATLFCAYPTPVTTYQHGNVSIVIKAWGTTVRTYYPNMISPSHASDSYSIPRCTVGGILIETTDTFDMVEACSSFICTYISDYESNSKILLPTSIIMLQYTVKLSAWKNGKQILSTTQTCEGRPICELIECLLCWEHVFNPQCWTTTEIILTTTICLLSLITCRLIYPLFTCTWWLLKKLVRTSKKIIITITPWRHHRGKYVLAHFPTYHRPITRRTLKHTSTITIAICLLRSCNSCSDIVSITGTTQYCTTNSTSEHCVFEQVATLQLQPVGQDVCLLLRNSKNEPAGVITLRVNDIAYTCQQRTEYYTRDHKFSTESHHQCWNSLSCKGETCKDVTTSTNIKEFSRHARNNPGHTFCSPSCKCLWCNLCFWCKETCLFYKVYAQPSSETIYRVFTCPTWSITVSGTITLETSTKRQQHAFVIYPARPYIWNSIELTLTATTVPNLPILASYFLTDGITTSKVESSPAGMLLPNSVGQLQCASKKSAFDFSTCRFSPTTCHCTPLVYEASCYCPEGNVTKYLNNAHHKLPLSGKDVVILQRENVIQAKTTSGASTSIQVSMHGLSLFTKRVNNKCDIETGSLTGCYSCFQGAHVQMSCTSSLSEETAEIHCGDQTQLVKCARQGIISDIVLHFTTSSINMNCSVHCPAGQTTITLQGNLVYVNEPIFQETSLQYLDVHHATSSGFSIHDISSVISKWFMSLFDVFKFWKFILILLFVLFITLCIFRVLRRRSIHATLIKKSR